jgi:hypothetical protein
MQLIFLAIACLSVQFFAKYAGHNMKKVTYDLVGLGGLFFLLTASSGLDLGILDIFKPVVTLVAMMSPIMGWLCLLGATLMGVLEMMKHLLQLEKLLPH